jgi:hypothetical protein
MPSFVVVIFRDMTPFSLHVNQCYGGIYYLHLQGRNSAEPDTGVQRVQ